MPTYVHTNIFTMYSLQKRASRLKQHDIFEQLESSSRSSIPADLLKEVSAPAMSKYMCIYIFMYHE